MREYVFCSGIKKLEAAFRNGKELNDETMKVYWDMLEDKFSDDEFNRAVVEIISTEIYFPVIAVFLKHSAKKFPPGHALAGGYL